MHPAIIASQQALHDSSLAKKINNEKDVIHFKTKSPAYKNTTTYIDLLCQLIKGTGNKTFNHNYELKNEIFKKCSHFLEQLETSCDDTDLNLSKTAGTLRFGHVAFRDWFDVMRGQCKEFVKEVAGSYGNKYMEELTTYLVESFGNRMRIDYGTGHELNFIIFTMGLVNLVGTSSSGDGQDMKITAEKLELFVKDHGWDIHSLFANKYLKLCRRVQAKFRLEPAGSRGVYNMDDFQFLPFLFGAAQLSGIKYIPTSDFYLPEQVDMFKNDYIFFEAVDFILNNKRGPFNEHSYTLWGFTNLGSWDNIFRRIRAKFTDDVLSPFPIVQHLLFGDYILTW